MECGAKEVCGLCRGSSWGLVPGSQPSPAGLRRKLVSSRWRLSPAGLRLAGAKPLPCDRETAREVWQQGGVLQLADDISVLRSVFLDRRTFFCWTSCEKLAEEHPGPLSFGDRPGSAWLVEMPM